MKSIRPNPTQSRKVALPKLAMPRFAQITGMIVTSIVVFGTDTDVLLAVPLGILAGGLATFFVAFSDYRDSAKKI
jgi:hypothetical protein